MRDLDRFSPAEWNFPDLIALPNASAIGSEVDVLAVPRPTRNTIVGGIAHYLMNVPSVDRHHIDSGMPVPTVRVEGDPTAIRRPARRAGAIEVGKHFGRRAIDVRHPNLAAVGTPRREDQLLSVRGRLRAADRVPPA